MLNQRNNYNNFKERIKVTALRLKNFQQKESIIIFSEARGGSTWLMEILLEIPGTVANWEPLHVDKGVVPTEFNFGWTPGLDMSNTEEKFYDFLHKIICFKVANKWTMKFTSLKNIFHAKKVVTKFVRANQLLVWFTVHFSDLKHKPIYLLRHPITTSISQLKTFHNISGKDLTEKLNDHNHYIYGIKQKFYSEDEYLKNLNSHIERQVALWCMQNVDLIDHQKSNKWMTLYYEDLVLNPVNQMKIVNKEISLNLRNDFFQSIDFQKPSDSDFNRTYKSDKKKQLGSFLDYLDNKTLIKIQNIFDHFGLKKYSAFDPYPIKY